MSELSDAVNIELVCRAFLTSSEKYLIFTHLRKPHRQKATQHNTLTLTLQVHLDSGAIIIWKRDRKKTRKSKRRNA